MLKARSRLNGADPATGGKLEKSLAQKRENPGGPGFRIERLGGPSFKMVLAFFVATLRPSP